MTKDQIEDIWNSYGYGASYGKHEVINFAQDISDKSVEIEREKCTTEINRLQRIIAIN